MEWLASRVPEMAPPTWSPATAGPARCELLAAEVRTRCARMLRPARVSA